MVWVPVPTALGVYVTEHDAELPEPESVQLVELNVPLPLDVKLTVPVGVVAPGLVSVTVAVQLVDWLTATVLSVQVTVVVVVC